jgi:hypothetical protein
MQANAAHGEVMFFEPLPAGDDAIGAALPESPPWSGPPARGNRGGAGPLTRPWPAARNVVVRLPTIRAFSRGSMLDVEVPGKPAETEQGNGRNA